MQFIHWLRDEMKFRLWSQNQLAERAGLTPASISMVLNGHRNAGPDFCKAIAKAFGMTDVEVFRKAGLLSQPFNTPLEEQQVQTLQELFEVIKGLSLDEQRELLRHARLKYQGISDDKMLE